MKTSSVKIEQVLVQTLSSRCDELQKSLELIIQGPIPPRYELTFQGLGRYRKKPELEALAVLSYYVGDSGYLLREFLLSKVERDKNLLSVNLMLTNKDICFEHLMWNYSDRDFFGNLLPLIRKIARTLRLSFWIPPKPKRKVRIRGYRDHGTMAPSDKWR